MILWCVFTPTLEPILRKIARKRKARAKLALRTQIFSFEPPPIYFWDIKNAFRHIYQSVSSSPKHLLSSIKYFGEASCHIVSHDTRDPTT